jgi:hypothetical protein
MKTFTLPAALAVWLCSASAFGQGTFLFDQQSSVDGSYLEGAVLDLQAVQPFGQSFTPSLTSVGFVRLYLYDSYTPNTLPGTLYVNLRAGSITGQVLGTSTPVTLAPHFNGLVDFFFQTPVSLTPQTTYFLQPVLQSGNRWGIFADTYNYPGGTEWSQGAAVPSRDLWFREGIVIPEPSSAALGLLGPGAFIALRFIQRRRNENR